MDPLDVANLNQDAAFEYLINLGYPVTRRSIKYAFDRREVIPVRLSNGNYVSRRDMLNWIESRRQPVCSRYVGFNKDFGPNAAAAQ